MTFFPALPYTPHKALSYTPCFLKVGFRFEQTRVFHLPFPLLCFIIIINHSNYTISNFCQCFYTLYFVLVYNAYIAHKNVELALVFSSVFCYLLCFLENRA